MCPHCGCEFATTVLLQDHARSRPCGKYTTTDVQALIPALKTFYDGIDRGAKGARGGPSAENRNGAREGEKQRRTSYVGSTTPVSGASSPRDADAKANNPYAHLSPEERANFEAEMRQVEEKYGGAMSLAMSLPPEKRIPELNRVKNMLTSKQSLTRKKYGIRLRERRPKAEIDAERSRLMSLSLETPPMETRVEPWDRTNALQGGSALKRLRSNNQGERIITSPPADPGSAAELPRKMPGKDGDKSRDSARFSQQKHPTPSSASTQAASSNATPTRAIGEPRSNPSGGGPRTSAGTRNDPMQLDDLTDESSDSEDEDDDIPAFLPPKTQ
ncbi:hypothetical protein UVI_02020840 [Ustilaginoidea virens]|nr:hypothetical protein UVI_02020840 [Ustilaginoidea virens]